MLGRQADLIEKLPSQLARAEPGLKGQVIDAHLSGLLDDRSAKALHHCDLAGVAEARLEKVNALRRGSRFRYLLDQPARIGTPDLAQIDGLVGGVQSWHWQKGLGHGGPETHAELDLSSHEREFSGASHG